MPPLSPDTAPDAERCLIRLAREMPPGRKLDIAVAMSRTLRQLAEAGVRSRYPDATEDEIRKRLAARWLPREIVIAAYGWDPEREGY
ncbi:MAG: hypothetical protein JXA90_05005 [Planctomycetes bacterium]|nr:hypothetical protein [Planctomycetota bacterium]